MVLCFQQVYSCKSAEKGPFLFIIISIGGIVMLFCRYCEGKTPDDSLFCAHCGHSMQPSLEPTTHTLPSGDLTRPSQPLQHVPPHDSSHEEDEEQQIIPPVVPPEVPTTGSVPSVQGIPQVGTVPSIPAGAGTVATTLTAGTLAKVVVVLAVCAAVIFTGIKAIPPILNHSTTTSTPITSITPITKTLPVPPTQTSCPVPGTARAAVTAPLVLGKHQNLIYTTSQNQAIPNPYLPVPATMKRYDVTTGQITNIVKLDTSVTYAKISADGLWVLFATAPSSIHEQAAIQMIRMDGQGLQTLYCSPVKYDPTNYYDLASISSIAWSADQKLVIFTEGDYSNNPPSLYLLNLANGTVQKELQPDPGNSTSYYPHLWINNTHIALLAVNTVNGSQDVSIFVLDINKGVNQLINNLQLITKDSTLFTFNFDISLDHMEYIVGKSSNLSPFISNISTIPMTGGSEHIIFTSQTLQVLDIRAISNTMLLVYILDPSGTTNQSGLYKMHIDGSGLVKLIDNNNGSSGQESVIDVSRDRSMYAIGLTVYCGMHCQYSLIQFGFLSGGKPITLPDSNSSHNSDLVGWTTM